MDKKIPFDLLKRDDYYVGQSISHHSHLA